MSQCVETTYYKNPKGYGVLNRGGKTVKHHRLVYIRANKLSWSDIAGLVVRHTCDNPACVNPAHLVIGTHQDNMNDMKKRNRASTVGNPASRRNTK